MLSLKDLLMENIIDESASIIPQLKDDQTTLYDIIKDNIKGIVYTRVQGYTNYIDGKALKKFIKDNKVDEKDMFVTVKGKKPTAPDALQQLFNILCKCIVVEKDFKQVDLKKAEQDMHDILIANGINLTFYLTKFYFCMMIGPGTECNINFADTNSKMFGY